MKVEEDFSTGTVLPQFLEQREGLLRSEWMAKVSEMSLAELLYFVLVGDGRVVVG